MLSFRIQIVVVAVMALAVAWSLRLLAKGKLDWKLGIGWIAVFCSVAGLALMPRLLDRMARAVGIASPVNMLFFFGFLFCAAILFSLSRRIAALHAQIRRIAQDLALAKREADAARRASGG